MFLSDAKIEELARNKDLIIRPTLEQKNIRPNGIRIHLGDTLIQYENQAVDPTKDINIKYSEIDLRKDTFTLPPGGFVLGSTFESIQTPRHIFGLLDGRSTLARLGLTIHITAAVIDSLYEEPRTITLEIYNAGNMSIVLSNKMAIGALLFAELDQPVTQNVQNQYRHQNGVTPANLKGQFS